MTKSNKTLSLFAIMAFFVLCLFRAVGVGVGSYGRYVLDILIGVFAVGPLITYSLYVFTFT